MARRLLLVSILWLAAAAATAGAAGGPEVDVSMLEGPQVNATIAVDPRNDRVLLAGSNSLLEGTERSYSSTDGGSTWATATTFPAPQSLHAACASDPGVAIDRLGRQYFSYVRAAPCSSQGIYRVYLVTRPGPDAPWSTPIIVAPLGAARLDDKPTIAVDNSPASPHRNRVYLAWSRLSRITAFSIVISHSDNGGRSWSRPVTVSRAGMENTYASVATSRNGAVYVAWTDMTNFGLKIARSTDGGAHFGPGRGAASFVIVTIPHCGIGIVIPAEPRSCVQANPIVTVDTSGGRYSGRVYVSYTGTDFEGGKGASLTTFTADLRPLSGFPLTHRHQLVAPSPPKRRGDQFWAQSAVDQSNGTLWMCFYDTLGDLSRKTAHYACTLSKDGGKSWAPVARAASVASDETQKGASYQYGYYQGLAVANGVAHPIWTDTRQLSTLGEEIYVTALAESDLKPPAPSG